MQHSQHSPLNDDFDPNNKEKRYRLPTEAVNEFERMFWSGTKHVSRKVAEDLSDQFNLGGSQKVLNWFANKRSRSKKRDSFSSSMDLTDGPPGVYGDVPTDHLDRPPRVRTMSSHSYSDSHADQTPSPTDHSDPLDAPVPPPKRRMSSVDLNLMSALSLTQDPNGSFAHPSSMNPGAMVSSSGSSASTVNGAGLPPAVPPPSLSVPSSNSAAANGALANNSGASVSPQPSSAMPPYISRDLASMSAREVSSPTPYLQSMHPNMFTPQMLTPRISALLEPHTVKDDLEAAYADLRAIGPFGDDEAKTRAVISHVTDRIYPRLHAVLGVAAHEQVGDAKLLSKCHHLLCMLGDSVKSLRKDTNGFFDQATRDHFSGIPFAFDGVVVRNNIDAVLNFVWRQLFVCIARHRLSPQDQAEFEKMVRQSARFDRVGDMLLRLQPGEDPRTAKFLPYLRELCSRQLVEVFRDDPTEDTFRRIEMQNPDDGIKKGVYQQLLQSGDLELLTRIADIPYAIAIISSQFTDLQSQRGADLAYTVAQRIVSRAKTSSSATVGLDKPNMYAMASCPEMQTQVMWAYNQAKTRLPVILSSVVDMIWREIGNHVTLRDALTRARSVTDRERVLEQLKQAYRVEYVPEDPNKIVVEMLWGDMASQPLVEMSAFDQHVEPVQHEYAAGEFRPETFNKWLMVLPDAERGPMLSTLKQQLVSTTPGAALASVADKLPFVWQNDQDARDAWGYMRECAQVIRTVCSPYNPASVVGHAAIRTQ